MLYEDTMLEKLEYLLETKNLIEQAIKDIGNNEINDETPFRNYPEEITKIHANILEICRVLQYIDEGGEFKEITTENLSYNDAAPYVQDIANAKKKLIENLNLKGISCDASYSFMDLVNLINNIE